jgi:hypothetical protein
MHALIEGGDIGEDAADIGGEPKQCHVGCRHVSLALPPFFFPVVAGRPF